MKKLSILLAALTLTLSACKETDQDKVADAQDCLDNASMASAQQCVDMVEGIESKGAYLIRCSAMFIQEGFMDASRLSSAMDAIENDGGSNGSTAMMSVLSFRNFGATTGENETAANLAVSYCDKAGSKGLVMLASISSIATTAAAIAGDTTPSQAQIQAALGTMAGDVPPYDAQTVAAGSAAVAAYESNCAGDGGSFGQFCEQFESAIGGATDPGQIGAQLAQCYTTAGLCPGF